MTGRAAQRNRGLGPLLLIVLLCAGCAAPKAWERGKLADPSMAWDPDPQLASYRDHVYISKEQASGSASAGGGGCGCKN